LQRASRAIISSWNNLLGKIRPLAIDVALAIGVALVVAATIAVSSPRFPDARPADAFAYLLAAAFGAVLLVRRRWPVGVLLASAVLLQVYYQSNYPTIWPAVPLAAALYSATAAGHLWWAVAVVAWYWVLPLFYYALGLLGPLEQGLNDLVRDGSLMLAVIMFGAAVRSHRALMAEASERLRRAAADREREARELRAARMIQQQLLPKELPALDGWHVAAYYRPARAVGGDFYDFLDLPDGNLVVVTGDVTDKGIPAALVMATTHSILRNEASDHGSPGAVLERANERLYAAIPPQMFVTCLCVVLDPVSGRLRFANAGHNLPYVMRANGGTELRATGMPLGAMPGMTYEEQEAALAPGDGLLMVSDGLVEAHNAAGEMFGFPRLQAIVAHGSQGNRLIAECLAALRAFVGRDWEQEDDITIVTLQRMPCTNEAVIGAAAVAGRQGDGAVWRALGEFAIPSEPGNERLAMAEVAGAVAGIGLTPRQLERLKTAVAEATMNAMEHGNKYRKDVPVRIQVAAADNAVKVRITDEGGGPVPRDLEAPDLEAKLEGEQKPRGWGLFLIESMVDEMTIENDEGHTTAELVMHLDDRLENGG
jgi:serine phosphatase RsbU (regulator of sigma subunit)/anti-sigma regulatory factor (Ser/Thr protein kinase)